VFFQIDTMSKI